MTIQSFVSLTQLRDHLKLPQPATTSPATPASDDADLQLKLDAALQLVCEYIADQHPADTTWIAEIESWGAGGSPVSAAPPIIVLAVLEQASEFYRFRGDDPYAEKPVEMGYLSPCIENLLSRYKNRAFA